MPICKHNLHRYPGGSITSPEWLSLRSAILARAGLGLRSPACECTGQCGARHASGRCGKFDRMEYPSPYASSRTGVSLCVLTIAHIDQDPTHNDPANLLALCQSCHNRLDAPARAQHRAEREAAERGQMSIAEIG